VSPAASGRLNPSRGRPERTEQPPDQVRAEPLGVHRSKLEVARSLDRRQLSRGAGQADQVGVQRGAVPAGLDLRACAIGLLAGRTAIGKGGDGQQVMLSVVGSVGLRVHLVF
jgi:hypothetical protein